MDTFIPTYPWTEEEATFVKGFGEMRIIEVCNDSSVDSDGQLSSSPGDSFTFDGYIGQDSKDSEDSVYESRFSTRSLPELAIPEGHMPKDVAYRMIKDHMDLDGNPAINLASFVSTYMEEEAEKLMIAAFAKNFVDHQAYPLTADIQRKCVNMVAELFSVPVECDQQPIGMSTIGSSEAIMLCTLAMKVRWVEKQKAKAVKYFEIEACYVYCSIDRYVLDPQDAINLIDENTVGICCILGTTYTGEYEDVKTVNKLLLKKNLDIPIHVDAASGGFVAPFIVPELEWDFRLENVASINVSGHKYGLVYPGIGWAVWRSSRYFPKELSFGLNYLGVDQASFTLNFSKGSAHVVGQYYQFLRLGKSGYRNIMRNITKTADYLASSLEALGFMILSETGRKGVPLVAFRIDPKGNHSFDEFAITHRLRERGWIVPAYTMAAHAQRLKLLRIVCRSDFSRNRCDNLIKDIHFALETLKKEDRARLQPSLNMSTSKSLRPNSIARAHSAIL